MPETQYVLCNVVLPEGASRGADRAGPRKGAIGLFAFVIALAGGVLFLALTSPSSPEAAPTTIGTTSTTTPLDRPIDLANFSVDQIATGVPLDFSLAARFDDVAPYSVLEHQGVLYAFGAKPGDPFGSSFQLEVWKSFDGETWEGMGEVLPPDQYISSIQSTPQGLLAMGGEPVDSAAVWLSQDGVNWKSLDLPAPGPGRRGGWGTATANGEVIAVAVNAYLDPVLLVEERFLEHLGLDAIPEGLWMNWTHGLEDIRFELVGPFELRFAAVNAAELGVTDEERELFDLAMGPGDSVRLLATADRGATWFEGSSEVHWIEGLYTLPDDTLLARGYGSSGAGSYQSFDGITWSKISGRDIQSMTTWREGMVGLVGGRNLNLSIDGLTWKSSSLSDLIPWRLDWYNVALSGGEGGIATVMVAENHQPINNTEQPEPMAVEREGLTFLFDPYSTSVEATLDGDLVYRWGPFTGESFTGRIDADFNTGAVGFLDENGDHLATFTIDELVEIQNEMWSRPVGDEPEIERHTLLAFSPDGENWSIQPLPEGLPPDSFIASIEVTADRVFILLLDSGQPWSGEASGFSVWSAPIP